MLAVVGLLSAGTGWSALLRATASLHLIQAAGGSLRLPSPCVCPFSWTTAAWGVHFSWWITGMHKGKWKQKEPPRAWLWLPPASHQPCPTSIELAIYSTCARGQNSRVTSQGHGGKCDKLGSDNPIYQSHFPYPSLSFFNQTMRALNQVTIQCSFLPLK